MKTKDLLNKLVNNIHTVIIATCDKEGKPYTCAIDMMLEENEKLYFLTARGKSFYQRLMERHDIALTGLKGEDTMSSIAISLTGKVRNIKKEKLDDIFKKNSYMNEIYPDVNSQEALEVFEIYEYSGEYFDLSQKPIYRQSFSNKQIINHQYKVKSSCTGCFKCLDVCPQKCIDINTIPVKIQHEHCLHCGGCMEVCPVSAIDKGGR